MCRGLDSPRTFAVNPIGTNRNDLTAPTHWTLSRPGFPLLADASIYANPGRGRVAVPQPQIVGGPSKAEPSPTSPFLRMREYRRSKVRSTPAQRNSLVFEEPRAYRPSVPCPRVLYPSRWSEVVELWDQGGSPCAAARRCVRSPTSWNAGPQIPMPVPRRTRGGGSLVRRGLPHCGACLTFAFYVAAQKTAGPGDSRTRGSSLQARRAC